MTDPAVVAHHANRAAFASQLDTRPRTFEQTLVAVTLHCTTCARSERSGPCFDHDAALDLMSTLGWIENPGGSDTWYCPTCTRIRAVRDALDTDDQWNEGRHRDNTAAAVDLAHRTPQ